MTIFWKYRPHHLKQRSFLLPVIILSCALLAPAAYASPAFYSILRSSDVSHSLHLKVRDSATPDAVAKVNVTHKRIPEIGWPSMTMDFPLLRGAQTEGVKLGEPVWIVLSIAPGGGYAIKEIAPASEPKPILHSGDVLAEGIVNRLP